MIRPGNEEKSEPLNIKILKDIGAEVPYPLYEVKTIFRGRPRTVEYYLYRKEEKRTGIEYWLKCEERYDGLNDDCFCCPNNINPIEKLNIQTTVLMDAMKPGKPVNK